MKQDEQAILLIDDDQGSRTQMRRFLADHEFIIYAVENAEKAQSALREKSIAVIISDYKLPGLNGLQLLNWAKQQGYSQPFILITAFGDVETAVKAMQAGAHHFLEKPVSPQDLRDIVQRACAKHKLFSDVERHTKHIDQKYGIGLLIGKTPAMKKVFESIRLVAPTTLTVLITGESGTGKDVVARAIHQNSPQRQHQFIALNAAALPENLVESELFGHKRGAFTGASSDRKGYFEAAAGGTLLIDEIGELSLGTQAKLLRAIEERNITPLGDTREIPVNLRIIASTNRKLEEMVAKKEFRDDLYYRLSVLPISLPALRERKDDIPLFVAFFVKEFTHKQGRELPDISAKVMDVFRGYPWPGNVRELKHTIESIMVLTSDTMIELEHLPPKLLLYRPALTQGSLSSVLPDESGSYSMVGRSLAEIEKEAIIRTLKACKGNKTEAAKILKIGVRTIHRKISEYGLI